MKQKYLGSRTAAGKCRGSQRKTLDSLWRRPSEQFYRKRRKAVNTLTLFITTDKQVSSNTKEEEEGSC